MTTTARFPVALTIVALAAVAILVSLGNWQWRRLAEKEAFLAALRQQMHSQPASLNERPDAYQRVRIEGDLLADRAIPVRATIEAGVPGKLLGGLGFWWLAPVKLAEDRIVLVNLGFVPAGPDTRPVAVTVAGGERTITGIVRPPDHGNFFLPADDPGKAEFFRRDPALLAGALGMKLQPEGRLAPFTIDAERNGSPLQPPVGFDYEDLIASIPNNHLGYAFTWWGLAATLLAVYAAYLISLRRSGAG